MVNKSWILRIYGLSSYGQFEQEDWEMAKRDAMAKVSWSKKATMKKKPNSTQELYGERTVETVETFAKQEKETKETAKAIPAVSKRQKIAKQTFKKVHSLKAVPPRKKKVSTFRRKQEYWPDHLKGQSDDSDY